MLVSGNSGMIYGNGYEIQRGGNVEKGHIGISFDPLRSYGNTLALLFDGSDAEAYAWYVSDSENYADARTFFLPDGIIQRSLRAEIDNAEYYIHLLSLYGVPKEKKFDISAEKNYADHMKSDAKIALFGADAA